MFLLKKTLFSIEEHKHDKSCVGHVTKNYEKVKNENSLFHHWSKVKFIVEKSKKVVEAVKNFFESLCVFQNLSYVKFAVGLWELN